MHIFNKRVLVLDDGWIMKEVWKQKEWSGSCYR